MRIVSICLTAFLSALLSTAGWADIVTLKDGSRVEGDLKKTTDGYDLVGPQGDVTHLGADTIASIQLGKAISPDSGISSSNSSPKDRLASLKRSVEQVDDLNQIISRYKLFIEQTKTTAPDVAADAQNELTAWQARSDQKMIKVGGKWMTPDEHQQALSQAGGVAKQAYDLMKQNKLQDADAAVKKVLAIDPQNPAALYLQGVLLYQQDKIVPARKSFELVNAQLHGDPATLNNLGVIAWRQGQFINALNFYNEAMLAMPANKEILTNVAEALAGLKDDLRKQLAVQKVQRQFAGQEAKLEMTMAQYGWYRWGTLWVDRAQLDQLKAAESDIKAKIDSLQKTFDEINKKIDDNNRRIDTDNATLVDLENRATYVDNSGNLNRLPLPDIYYTTQGEVTKLQGENVTLENQKQPLRDQARHIDASMPRPKFTGDQQLIGAEGTPLIGGVAAATQPSATTQPGGPPPPLAVTPPVNAAPTPSILSPTTLPTTSPTTSPARAAPSSAPTAPPAPAAPTTDRVF